jgi:hypothetical protein
VKVLDIPPAALTVTEYQMMSRTCGCGQVTTAPAPTGVTGGPVCYGPNVTDAATLLASTDVIGVERAADLMGALLKAPVSTGFVSRCLVRLDAALITAGFEGALKDALRTADVLGTDETPAPLTAAATSAEDCGNPHVYTVRTMRAYTGAGPPSSPSNGPATTPTGPGAPSAPASRENRLVARSLEARWEARLAALAEAGQALDAARDSPPTCQGRGTPRPPAARTASGCCAP